MHISKTYLYFLHPNIPSFSASYIQIMECETWNTSSFRMNGKLLLSFTHIHFPQTEQRLWIKFCSLWSDSIQRFKASSALLSTSRECITNYEKHLFMGNKCFVTGLTGMSHSTIILPFRKATLNDSEQREKAKNVYVCL